MITVVGMWEETWMDPERTERRLWKQTIQAYDVDRWIMAPVRGGPFSSPEQFETMEEALESAAGQRLFLIPDAETALHPKPPLYPDPLVLVLGNVPEALHRFVRPADMVRRIETPNEVDLFAPVALGIALEMIV